MSAGPVEHPDLREDVPLAAFTTYKLGGPAAWYLEVASPEAIAGLTVPDGMPVLVLGRGSNLVVADAGFPGLVIRPTGDLASVAVDADGVVTAGGAASLPIVARSAAAADRGGLSWMVGVPGSVGGAVAMNAGCHGAETADLLIDATVHDLVRGAAARLDAAALGFGYRTSNLGSRQLVVSARFATTPSTKAAEDTTMREITRWRRDHQPGGTHNAGSVFANPPGDAAGRIIDEVGLKGLAVGGATVSHRHANFIEAGPTATAADIHALMVEVRGRVRDATGIDLRPEIRFVGFGT